MALAQELSTNNTEPQGIADIVVTAQKRAESSQSVPISIAAVDDTTLARAGAVTRSRRHCA